MKYRVLSPITQGLRLESGTVHERQLVKGDTVEVDDKEAVELIACGAIDPEPISQSNAAESADVLGENQSFLADGLATSGAGTSTSTAGENTGSDQGNAAGESGAEASAAPPPESTATLTEAETTKKSTTKKANQ